MKKNEIKFNKNSVKKYAVCLIKHRRLFFAVFFGALFIFTFNVIYENVYYNMEHIDYEKSRNFEDDEIKRNIIFEKVIEDIKFREQIIRDVRNKEYRNPFIFNDGKDSDDSDSGSEDSIILPTKPPILRTH